ncbi:hypothetical protein ACW73L_15490 [Methylolobus aquaticus]
MRTKPRKAGEFKRWAAMGGVVLSTCFIMQPFDGGVFDGRYEEVVAPAVRAAGLEPYRVDRDASVSIPIDDIERGIRDARVCLAEITLDNPNVWFELGYAIAAGKEVVLVCSDERTSKFPFDVQHRSIITYSTKTKGGYTKLEADISSRIKAYLTKAQTVATASAVSRLQKLDGLDQFEVVALAAIVESFDHPEDRAIAWQVKRDMEAGGFTAIAASIAFKSLAEKGFIQSAVEYNADYDQTQTFISLTEVGWKWVMENRDCFTLQRKPAVVNDDIPF